MLARPFVGLVGTTTHWLFNRSQLTGDGADAGGQCVSAVVSADRALAAWDTERIARTVEADLRAALPAAAGARCTRAVVVKEKAATIAPTLGAERRRPEPTTPIPNLVLAGDWVRTGLPPTIESAVLSGHRAAELVATHLEG